MKPFALQNDANSPLETTLQTRLVEFIRLARENGFCVGITEEIDAQRVALFCGITHPKRLHWGLRSLLCSNQDDWDRFDDLFNSYWYPGNVTRHTQSIGDTPLPPQLHSDTDNKKQREGSAAEADRPGEGEAQDASQDGTRKGASRQENLMQADFRFLADTGQMREMERLVERLARKMRRRLRRREKLLTNGRRIDLRRTVRNSLRYGGTPLQLVFRQRIRRQPRLLLLVDVSRSMSMYSYVFLRFARGIVNVFSDADAFAYHTQLVNITSAMRQPDLIKLQQSLAIISLGWSGGTRIAESLKRFNQDYGDRLNDRSIVVIVSDGLDTDAPEQMPQQLKKIKQRCRKLVWLNPLLGRDGYEPKTASMLGALPFIDLFAPAHNLRSLMNLEPELIQL